LSSVHFRSRWELWTKTGTPFQRAGRWRLSLQYMRGAEFDDRFSQVCTLDLAAKLALQLQIQWRGLAVFLPPMRRRDLKLQRDWGQSWSPRRALPHSQNSNPRKGLLLSYFVLDQSTQMGPRIHQNLPEPPKQGRVLAIGCQRMDWSLWRGQSLLHRLWQIQ